MQKLVNEGKDDIMSNDLAIYHANASDGRVPVRNGRARIGNLGDEALVTRP